ncbi:MAG: hypothetical protein WCX83_02335 [Candidatus Cloacimonas sp.]|nr:hypothetical protein [Candidatus Cloacimonadota bacterium]
MNKYLNPTETIVTITKMKYKNAMVPLLLVVVSVGLDYFFAFEYSRYLSLFGLIVFLITLRVYRLNNVTNITSNNALVSPISGKVTSIEKTDTEIIVTINKNFHNTSDIRLSAAADFVKLESCSDEVTRPLKKHHLPTINDKISSNWFVKGSNVHYFPKHNDLQGSLIGLLLGCGSCIYTFPTSISLSVIEGDPVKSGETIIGTIQ